MDFLQRMEIEGYFRLHERIREIQSIIKELEIKFYNQSFYPQTYTEGGEIQRVGFNVENRVVSYVNVVQCLEDVIERMTDKQSRFRKYLDVLDPGDCNYLINKYKYGAHDRMNEGIEKAAHNAIMDIEENINDKYGFSNDKKNSIKESYQQQSLRESVAEIAELLET